MNESLRSAVGFILSKPSSGQLVQVAGGEGLGSLHQRFLVHQQFGELSDCQEGELLCVVDLYCSL